MVVRDQLRILGGCLRVVAGNPFMLIYPFLTATIVVGTLLGFAAVAISMWAPVGLAIGGSLLRWTILVLSFVLMLYLGLPLIIMTLQVAYCYEIHEYYRGHCPLPGTGLVVALRNLKQILSATLVIAAAFNSGRAAANGGGEPGDAAEVTGLAGASVLNTILPPGIAIEDASPRALEKFAGKAVGGEWEQAFLASQGITRISGTLFFLSLAAGVGLIASLAVGLVPLSAGPYVVVLAFLSPLVGFFAAALVQATFTGPISTALYVYAHQEEVPGRLGLEISQLAKLGER